MTLSLQNKRDDSTVTGRFDEKPIRRIRRIDQAVVPSNRPTASVESTSGIRRIDQLEIFLCVTPELRF